MFSDSTPIKSVEKDKSSDTEDRNTPFAPVRLASHLVFFPSRPDSSDSPISIDDITTKRNRRHYGRFEEAESVSAVVMNSNHGIAPTPTRLVNAIADGQVPKFSPFEEVVTPASEIGKPHKSIRTRNTHTRLVLREVIGRLAIYTEETEETAEKLATPIKKEFIKNLLKGSPLKKEQTFNAETASPAIKKKHRNQNKVMKKRAKEVTKKIFNSKRIQQALDAMNCSLKEKILLKKRFTQRLIAEWTHGISYYLKGEAAQDPENLVYAFNHANSKMMVIEKYLNKRHDEGKSFRLTVTFEGITEEVCGNIVMQFQEEGNPTVKEFIIDPMSLNKPVEQTFQLFEIQQHVDNELLRLAEDIIDEDDSAHQSSDNIRLNTPVVRK